MHHLQAFELILIYSNPYIIFEKLGQMKFETLSEMNEFFALI